MAENESVSDWIEQLKDGRDAAAEQLWQRYVGRLVKLARRKLGAASRRSADEEDVVISVFDGLIRGVNDGRFPKLDDRTDLWRILVVLTERNAWNRARRNTAAKRGGTHARREAAPATDSGYLAGIVDGRPTPEFVVEFADTVQGLMVELDDELLSRVATEKMQGYTNAEIADRLNIGLRSVERKLGLIRRIWQTEVQQ